LSSTSAPTRLGYLSYEIGFFPSLFFVSTFSTRS
jgi:hypothetical protein